MTNLDTRVKNKMKGAKDGDDRLMPGTHMVVSGFKNKVKVALSNILSDKAVAKKLYYQRWIIIAKLVLQPCQVSLF